MITGISTCTIPVSYTHLSADENLEKITDSEKSDLTVSYFNGKYSELYSTYSTYNSFKMCADLGQLSYQYIDGGVRIPVSYTHLDVYKRQQHDWAKPFDNAKITSIWNLAAEIIAEGVDARSAADAAYKSAVEKATEMGLISAKE